MQEFSLNYSYEDILTVDPSTIAWFPTIGLKLTSKCALKCEFCCEPNRIGKVVSVEKFKEITNKLWEAGTKRLCLTGGDPLLYPHLLELVQHTNNIGFYNLLITADGTLLKKKISQIYSYLNGVRLSIHGIGSEHDLIVGRSGVFDDIESSVILMKKLSIPIFASTVVTNNNKNNINAIVEWCINNKIEKFYLYGLVRSGLGNSYIKANGMPSMVEFYKLVNDLKQQYSNEKIEIKYYDYTENAGCILVYGDGKILIDPYFNSPNYQLEIGNILYQNSSVIWKSFSIDTDNIHGYKNHLQSAI